MKLPFELVQAFEIIELVDVVIDVMECPLDQRVL